MKFTPAPFLLVAYWGAKNTAVLCPDTRVLPVFRVVEFLNAPLQHYVLFVFHIYLLPIIPLPKSTTTTTTFVTVWRKGGAFGAGADSGR